MTLLPLWPGFHRMPPPFTIRWSADAWDALYPLGCQGWREWPGWDELREQRRREIAAAFNLPRSLTNAWRALKP